MASRRLFDASPGRPAPVGLLDPDSRPELDFGPLRVRVPVDARLRMAGENDAVFFDLPGGWIRLSVLAAPRGGGLWPERAKEIATAQADLGAAVHSTQGEWGPELRIVSNGETNSVIGVDGERWMLLARASWPTGEPELIETMRELIRSSAVDRGDEPFPVKAPMRLTLPDDADQAMTGSGRPGRDESPYASMLTLVASDPPTQPFTSALDLEPRPSDHPRPDRTAGDPSEQPGEQPDPGSEAEPDPGRESAAGGRRGRRGGMLVAAALLLPVGVAGAVIGVRELSPPSPSPPQASPAQVAAPPAPRPAAPSDDPPPIRPSTPASNPPGPALALPAAPPRSAVGPAPAPVRPTPKATPSAGAGTGPGRGAPGPGTTSSAHPRTSPGTTESGHDTRRPQRRDGRGDPLEPLGGVVQHVVPGLR